MGHDRLDFILDSYSVPGIDFSFSITCPKMPALSLKIKFTTKKRAEPEFVKV
jgi:hypothetical protein